MKKSIVRHGITVIAVICIGLLGFAAIQWLEAYSSTASTLEIEKPIRPVKTLVVQPMQKTVETSFPGRVQASQRVNLAFRVSGPLIEFPVNEGQSVQKGDVLARIDPRDYQSAANDVQSAITQAQAELKAMQAGARPEDIKVLEAQVSAAEASLRDVELQLNRYKSLLDKGDVTRSQYDSQKAAYDVAEAHLETARENLNVGRKGARAEDVDAKKAQIQSLQAKLEIAQAALEDTYLRAPFAGLVAEKYVENYQHVEPKDPIVSLQDVSKIEIVVNMPEKDIVHKKPNQIAKTTASFGSVPDRTFEMQLKEFGAEADSQTKTYPITLWMPHPQGLQILPGMTAEITFSERGEAENDTPRFEIPVEAVYSDESGQSHAWIVNERELTVRSQAIETSGLQDDRITVTEGLKPGQRIVTAGVQYLRDGMKIKLWEN